MVLTALAGGAWTTVDAREEGVVVDRTPFAAFPMRIGEWSGYSSFLEPEIVEVLGADDYINATYVPAPAGTR